MRRKNVPVAARRTRACRWRRNPAWFGRTFFRASRSRTSPPFCDTRAKICCGLFWTGAKSSLFFPRKWLREERNFHTRENENDDSLLLPVANGVRRSKLLIYARNFFLVTIFTVVRPFPLNTFTCIRRKEWYSRCANGWTSSFFVGNNRSARFAASQSNLGL